jgi:plastocyanin
MIFLAWRRLPALGVGLLLLACGGGGGGSGMGPCTPGAATQLVKTIGDPAAWYLNNPLPTPLSVTARDANNCPVPGVVVNWAVGSGGGGVTPIVSTTNAAGVASTTDSIGATSPQTVTASFTGLPAPVTFTASASAPPTSAAVTVSNNFFSPNAVVMQTGSTVTWTWNSGGTTHDVAYDSGPTPLPASSAPQSGTATHNNTITAVGRYTYHCNFHANMSGSVTVVH